MAGICSILYTGYLRRHIKSPMRLTVYVYFVSSSFTSAVSNANLMMVMIAVGMTTTKSVIGSGALPPYFHDAVKGKRIRWQQFDLRLQKILIN